MAVFTSSFTLCVQVASNTGYMQGFLVTAQLTLKIVLVFIGRVQTWKKGQRPEGFRAGRRYSVKSTALVAIMIKFCLTTDGDPSVP